MTSDTPDLARMRREYQNLVEMARSAAAPEHPQEWPDQTGPRAATGAGLDERDLAPDWPGQFARWLADAVSSGMPEPNAMVLATADPTGQPSARSVLLKGYDARGFTFYTNYGSRKGRDLAANPAASLVFPWYALHRQVVVAGSVRRVDRSETEEYFAIRPRQAQLGAWASPQSTAIPSRSWLDEAWGRAATRFPDGVPAPPHWGGFRLVPRTVEFWLGRPNRLHDRLRYRRTGGDRWIVERLAP